MPDPVPPADEFIQVGHRSGYTADGERVYSPRDIAEQLGVTEEMTIWAIVEVIKLGKHEVIDPPKPVSPYPPQ